MKISLKKRWKILRVDPNIFAMSMIEGTKSHVTHGLPEDVQVITVDWNNQKRILELTLESKTFPLTNEIPILEDLPVITRLED